MGGIIVVVGYLVAVAASYIVGQPENISYLDRVKPSFILLAIGFALIGFVDDFVVPRLIQGKRGLGWKQKILMQLVLSVVAVGLCYGWSFDFEHFAAIFIILFFSNAYNFSDGLDGLAGTLLLGLCLGIVGVSLFTAWMEPVALMIVPLAGAIIPFLFLNAPPAKVFMGDVGSLPIGAILGLAVSCLTFQPGWAQIDAVTDMIGAGSSPVNAACFVLSLMMVVELVPVPLQILSVKLRKKKLFPYTPIHHAFEKAGWPETRVVWMFALTQLLLSLAAISILVAHLP